MHLVKIFAISFSSKVVDHNYYILTILETLLVIKKRQNHYEI